MEYTFEIKEQNPTNVTINGTVITLLGAPYSHNSTGASTMQVELSAVLSVYPSVGGVSVVYDSSNDTFVITILAGETDVLLINSVEMDKFCPGIEACNGGLEIELPVVTSDKEIDVELLEVCYSLDAGITILHGFLERKHYVIGGGVVSETILDLARIPAVGAVLFPCETEKTDWEMLCLSDDGGVTKQHGVIAYGDKYPSDPLDYKLYIGSTDVTATHTQTVCENADIEEVESCRDVTVAGTGYSIGDRIKHIRFYDTTKTPYVLVSEIFINETTNAVVTNTVLANSKPCDECVPMNIGEACYEATETYILNPLDMMGANGTSGSKQYGDVIATLSLAQNTLGVTNTATDITPLTGTTGVPAQIRTVNISFSKAVKWQMGIENIQAWAGATNANAERAYGFSIKPDAVTLAPNYEYDVAGNNILRSITNTTPPTARSTFFYDSNNGVSFNFGFGGALGSQTVGNILFETTYTKKATVIMLCDGTMEYRDSITGAIVNVADIFICEETSCEKPLFVKSVKTKVGEVCYKPELLSQTLAFTGAAVNITAPSNAETMILTAQGGGGGASRIAGRSVGGNSAKLSGTFNAANITIAVGGSGSNASTTPVFGGGGGGGLADLTIGGIRYSGGSGGGATRITSSGNDLIVAAGGGGGAGGSLAGVPRGDGGDASENGYLGGNIVGYLLGTKAQSGDNGGAGGVANGVSGTGGNGSAYQGGTGGAGDINGAGGGGGGGLVGGGGGNGQITAGAGVYDDAGGAGGSSFISTTATDTTYEIVSGTGAISGLGLSATAGNASVVYYGAIAKAAIFENCDGTRTFEDLITGEVIDPSLVFECPEKVEIDGTFTNWLPLCVDGVQWFVSEYSTIDNATGLANSTKVYKQGAKGMISLVAPTGTTITEGACVITDCVVAVVDEVVNGGNMFQQSNDSTTDPVNLGAGQYSWGCGGPSYPPMLATTFNANVGSGKLFTFTADGIMMGWGVMDATTVVYSYIPAIGQFSFKYYPVDFSVYGITTPTVPVVPTPNPAIIEFTFYDLISQAVPVVKVCLPETTYIDCQGIQQKINAIPVIVENQKDIRREYYCDGISTTYAVNGVGNDGLIVYKVNPSTPSIQERLFSLPLGYGIFGSLATVSDTAVATLSTVATGQPLYIYIYNTATSSGYMLTPAGIPGTATISGNTYTFRSAVLGYNKLRNTYILIAQNTAGANIGEWSLLSYDANTETIGLIKHNISSWTGWGATASVNDVYWNNGYLYMTSNASVPMGIYRVAWDSGLITINPTAVYTPGSIYNGVTGTNDSNILLVHNAGLNRYENINISAGTSVTLSTPPAMRAASEASLVETDYTRFYEEFCNGTSKGTFTLDGVAYTVIGTVGQCKEDCCDTQASNSTISNISLTENANGVMLSNGVFALPANVISFTVTAQAGSFDVSFDGGTTWALTGRIGSRTWGDGTIEIVSNWANVRIRSNSATDDIDVIWEYK